MCTAFTLVVGLHASSFYYKRSLSPKGIKPSTHSVNPDGELVENAVVVKDIEQTLSQEFCCYGYRHMTGELKEKGWIINHKKVYRLMKESKLLYGARIRVAPFKRNFIRFRSLSPNIRCNTCRWILNMFTCMERVEMLCF